MSTPRGQDGRWIKTFADETEVDKNGAAAGSRRRKDTSKETIAHLQGSSLNPFSLTWGSQTSYPRNMSETINRVRSYALVFAWIVAILRIMTKGILWLIAFFLFKGAIKDNDATRLVKTLGSCMTNSTASCSSEIEKKFFPSVQTSMQRTVSFKLAETGLADAKAIFEIQFPLFISNPLVLLAAAIGMTFVYWLLDYAYGLLIDIADTADAADPLLRFREKSTKVVRP